MRQWKRLTYYLVINIVLSACTTLLVLNVWDRVRNPGSEPFLPFPIVTTAAQETPDPLPSTTAETALTGIDPSPTPTYLVYQVKEYDTFESIAEEFKVSVNDLLAINGFTSTQPLGAGEVLLIPVLPTPVPEAGISIASVIGSGDLDTERVVLKQEGEGQVSLSGWTLGDMQGNIFTFPAVELVKDGSQLEIYTRAGTNIPGRVFWGLTQPVWEQSETVMLRDTAGLLRDSYVIP